MTPRTPSRAGLGALLALLLTLAGVECRAEPRIKAEVDKSSAFVGDEVNFTVSFPSHCQLQAPGSEQFSVVNSYSRTIYPGPEKKLRLVTPARFAHRAELPEMQATGAPTHVENKYVLRILAQGAIDIGPLKVACSDGTFETARQTIFARPTDDILYKPVALQPAAPRSARTKPEPPSFSLTPPNAPAPGSVPAPDGRPEAKAAQAPDPEDGGAHNFSGDLKKLARRYRGELTFALTCLAAAGACVVVAFKVLKGDRPRPAD